MIDPGTPGGAFRTGLIRLLTMTGRQVEHAVDTMLADVKTLHNENLDDHTADGFALAERIATGLEALEVSRLGDGYATAVDLDFDGNDTAGNFRRWTLPLIACTDKQVEDILTTAADGWLSREDDARGSAYRPLTAGDLGDRLELATRGPAERPEPDGTYPRPV